MMPWIYIIVPSLLLLAFLCWKEVKRPNRRRLAARLLASVIAVASLACIALPLKRAIRQEPPANKPISRITVQPPPGIQAIYWPQQLHAGEPLQLQGRYNNSSANPVQLLLSGFNEHLDSITIPAGQQLPFTLNTRPRHTGRATYLLSAVAQPVQPRKSAQDTLEKAPIPVVVLPLRPLKILILASAPDFENRFLASWLGQHGNMVAMRTAISKNKYSYTFLDTARFQLDHITPALLSAFDLLISDRAALNSTELGSIRTQVAEKGLGLIIKADSSAGGRTFYNQPFPLTAAADKSERAVSLQTASGSAGALQMEAPVYIQPLPGTQALVWDAQQHTMAAAGVYGAGRLVNTTLRNSYTWLLSGNRQVYETIWSLLLQKAARPLPQSIQWHIGTALPRVNMPVQLYLETAMPSPPATVNGAPLSLAQDGTLAFRWQGTYWPTRAGWQAAVAAPGDTSWWYAFEPNDWPAIATLENQGQDSKAAIGPQATAMPLPKIYFVLAFILAAAFLWVEEKMGLTV
ncbi:hypothetical protein F0L74_02740 [Chitinophaga agrisoli]|uniref:DUF4350 domain-containing protein n=1 Tax=Chitinophaga agrisoli TaxID=2607653 RepID=A0A5B2W1W7_9BACT|nr:hypothetical protein [Chitinophaga agrisoli]KAA2244898.1 hypothetical protein F0L74_02740 [Chitinophaga agrisoli]